MAYKRLIKDWNVALKKHELAILVGCLAIVVQLTVQFFYPADQALLRTTILGENVAWQPYSVLTKNIHNRFEEYEVTIAVDTKKSSRRLASLGASPNIDTMIKQATAYPVYMRILPFSMFWYKQDVDTLNVYWHDDIARSGSKKIAKELTTPVQEGGLKIAQGSIQLTTAKPGYLVTSDTVIDNLYTTKLPNNNTTIQISPTVQQPIVTNDAVIKLQSQLKGMINKNIVLQLELDQQIVKDTDIIKWLKIVEHKGSRPSVEVSDVAIKEFVAGVASRNTINAKSGIIKTVDGQQVSYKEGIPGKTINQRNLIDNLKQATNSPVGDAYIQVEYMTIKPSIVTSPEYTSSEKGLRAYIYDITKDGSIHLAFQQIGGENWSAQGRAWDSIPSASTYKLYIALRMFEDIESGKISYNSTIVGGTLSECLDRMIILSVNNCAEEYINRYGRRNMDSFVREHGFSSGTGFSFTDAVHSTAGDLKNYLVRLETGTLMKDEYKKALIERMASQAYRKGIPSGTKSVVADKVGFLWDYTHDAAIVYHPKGTYVLVIMTKSVGGYEKIRQITQKIESIIYP